MKLELVPTIGLLAAAFQVMGVWQTLATDSDSTPTPDLATCVEKCCEPMPFTECFDCTNSTARQATVDCFNAQCPGVQPLLCDNATDSSLPSDTTRTASLGPTSVQVGTTPTATPSLSAGQSRPSPHLSIGAGVGMSLGTGAVAICTTLLATLLCIKRRRGKRRAQESAHAGQSSDLAGREEHAAVGGTTAEDSLPYDGDDGPSLPSDLPGLERTGSGSPRNFTLRPHRENENVDGPTSMPREKYLAWLINRSVPRSGLRRSADGQENRAVEAPISSGDGLGDPPRHETGGGVMVVVGGEPGGAFADEDSSRISGGSESTLLLEQAKNVVQVKQRDVFRLSCTGSSWYRGKRMGPKMYNGGSYPMSEMPGEHVLACQNHEIQQLPPVTTTTLHHHPLPLHPLPLSQAHRTIAPSDRPLREYSGLSPPTGVFL